MVDLTPEEAKYILTVFSQVTIPGLQATIFSNIQKKLEDSLKINTIVVENKSAEEAKTD